MNCTVAIILINWNGIKETIEAVNSLLKSNCKKYKIIVYDNGSKENEALKIKKIFQTKRVIAIRSEKNYGYAEGSNRAVKWALNHLKPKYFIIANNDILVDRDCIQILIDSLEKNKAHGASPKIYDKEGRIWWKGQVKINLCTGVLRIRKNIRETCETDMITGCFMILRREVFQKAGFFNPKFFLSGHDTSEYSLRMKRRGFKLIYVPEAKITHLCGTSAKKLNLLKRLVLDLQLPIVLFSLLKYIKIYCWPLFISNFFFTYIKMNIQRIKKLASILNKK